MRARNMLVLALVLFALLTLPVTARAGSVDTSFKFELGKWHELDAKDGPITLHRIRLVEQSGITKSTFFRPGASSDFLRTVQVQIEYTNAGDKDWEAGLNIVWADGEDRTIDGYHGSEDLNKHEEHELVTVTLSSLKYGIDVAKKLKVKIEFNK
jgi:hypothetical protein